jgi:hypothetical protein
MASSNTIPISNSTESTLAHPKETYQPSPRASIDSSDEDASNSELRDVEKQDDDATRQKTQADDGNTGPAIRTVTAQDWNGPDDPENPYNWPMWKRVYATSVPALFGFTVYVYESIELTLLWLTYLQNIRFVCLHTRLSRCNEKV